MNITSLYFTNCLLFVTKGKAKPKTKAAAASNNNDTTTAITATTVAAAEVRKLDTTHYLLYHLCLPLLTSYE